MTGTHLDKGVGLDIGVATRNVFSCAVSQFTTTTYGRFLLVKLVLIAAMVSAGVYNQFMLTPRIAKQYAAGETSKGRAEASGSSADGRVVRTS